MPIQLQSSLTSRRNNIHQVTRIKVWNIVHGTNHSYTRGNLWRNEVEWTRKAAAVEKAEFLLEGSGGATPSASLTPSVSSCTSLLSPPSSSMAVKHGPCLWRRGRQRKYWVVNVKDISAYARIANEGLLQKRVEKDLLSRPLYPPDDPMGKETELTELKVIIWSTSSFRQGICATSGISTETTFIFACALPHRQADFVRH